uniref:interferon-induced protein 44-like isoform X1 n=1 Tax=Pristiophorus japonicus TaxID=55135 RepID=UPI00398EC26C
MGSWFSTPDISRFSKDDAIHYPTFDKGTLDSLRGKLCDYNPPKRCPDCVNILLFGMVGAGKSATINTFLSALDPHGRTMDCVPTGNDPRSLTPELRSFKSHSLKFWDLSGWNSLKNANQATKVLTMVLEGRVPPKSNMQEFNPDSNYAKYPVVPENVIHGVVFVVNTNTMDNISDDLMKQFQELQTIVAKKYIYRIVIGTNIDRLEISEKYYHRIYEYKPLQQKFGKFSKDTGMKQRIMFAISNEWNGDTIGLTKCILTLYALDNIVRNIDQYFKATD